MLKCFINANINAISTGENWNKKKYSLSYVIKRKQPEEVYEGEFICSMDERHYCKSKYCNIKATWF